VIGTEGAHPSWTGMGVPSLPASAKPLRMMAIPDAPTAPQPPPPPEPSSLLIDRPVRSGQTIKFPRGDVIVVGAVASGSEILAGGSIHVYGTLRGRAIAGLAGGEAGVFCRKMEAELVAIGGIYLTADQVPKAFRGRAVRARLQDKSILLTPLD
jgi:septum site-determining protein MinC